MNRADKMLALLRDGQPHSRRELHEAGGYYLTNNAAAELRGKGYDVRTKTSRVNGETVYLYQWFGSLPKSPQSDPEPFDGPIEDGRGDSENECEQLSMVAA